MFLIPRLIGVTTYFLILVGICYFITYTHYKGTKYALALYVFLLSVMGYFYVPYETADLYRLIPTMHFYSNMTLEGILNVVMGSLITPLVPIYYHVIGLFGVDELLPAITVFIAFSFCFAFFYEYTKNTQSETRYLALALFTYMARGVFLQTASNIRTGLALAILAWCVYEEFVERKSLTKLLPLYLSAACIHITGQFVCVCLVLYSLLKMFKKKLSFGKFLLLGGVVTSISVWGIEVANRILDKAQRYTEAYQEGTGYTYYWEALLTVLGLIIVGYCLKITKEKLECNTSNGITVYKGFADYVNFVWLLCLVDCLCGFIEFNIFMRLNYFIMMVSVPVITFVLQDDFINGNKSRYRFILLLSSIMLFIACARGDLCGYKFFE